MPPRAVPQRRSSRRVKVEKEDEATPSTTSSVPPVIADEESPGRVRKVDNDDDWELQPASGLQPGEQFHAAEANSSPVTTASTSTQQKPTAPTTTATTATANQATSTASTSRARGTAPARRFQTRTGIVRKSEADRKKLEQEEAERRQRRAQEAARGQRGAQRSTRANQRGAERGRGAGGGGFGARVESTGTSWAVDRPTSSFSRAISGSERVISELSGAKESSSRTGGETGDNSSLISDHVTSTGKGKGRASGRGQGGHGGQAVIEENIDADRTDIDRINLISSGDDSDADVRPDGRRSSQKRPREDYSLRPIRLEHHEHVKRAVGIEVQKLKTEQNIKSEAADESSDVLRKAEDIADTEAEDTMHLDSLPIAESGPARATSKKEVGIKNPPSSPEQNKAKIERKRRPSSKDTLLTHETIEEQQERLRYELELQRISMTLGSLSHAIPLLPMTAPNGSEFDLEVSKSTFLETQDTSARDGKIFLFQLPPMTPMLQHSSNPPTTTTTEAKSPTIKRENPEQPTIPSTSTTQQPPPPPRPPPSPTRPASPPPSLLTATTPSHHLPSQGGLIGTLRVHQSGKVTLDWGGTPMIVNLGTGVDFLEDAVLTVPASSSSSSSSSLSSPPPAEEETPTQPPGERADGASASAKEKEKEKEKENHAYKLAQLAGKFVVVPDWARLYE